MTDALLLVAGDPAAITGRHLYDMRLATALTQAGHAVTTRGLPGHFPDADTAATQAFANALAACADGQIVLVDGLVLGGLPDIALAQARRLRLVAIVHHPLAEEIGISPWLTQQLRISERHALGAATRVIATSHFTARRLAAAYGVDTAVLDVIEPGADQPIPTTCQPSGATPILLCVAPLVPRKGHQVLADALARLTDLAWRCDCIGDTTRDPACTRALRAKLEARGLTGRVNLPGSCPAEDLANAYRSTALFVLPSWYESDGMAVAAALAHGLPIVTTTGGALAETVPDAASIRSAPGDAAALADALRRVLTEPPLHAALAVGARAAALAMPSWTQAGAQLAAILERLPTRGSV